MNHKVSRNSMGLIIHRLSNTLTLSLTKQSILVEIPGLLIHYLKSLQSQGERLKLLWCTNQLISGLPVDLLILRKHFPVPVGRICIIELLLHLLVRMKARKIYLNKGIKAWESKSYITHSLLVSLEIKQVSRLDNAINQLILDLIRFILKNKACSELKLTITTRLKTF